MAQTGAIGTHIEANSPGYSRDIAVANARQIGGKYATVVNDALLCLMLLDVGIIPIHRINRNGLLDDNAHQKGYSAREYVRTAHAEVPDKRAPISLNNEPGQNDLERLRDFMLEGIDEANKLGRKLACFNWSYGNPEPSAETVLAPVYRAIAAGGHFFCVHEGTDAQHPTLKDCYPSLIGRFLDVQKKYGFKVLVTEFAASLDAWHGWQTWQTAQQFAKACEDTVREVYAPNGVYMTPFTLFQWKIGFDYINSDELKNAWAGINARIPVKEQPVTQQPGWVTHDWGKRIDGATVRNTANVNIRPEPNENSKPVLGVLKDGETVAYWDKPYSGGAYLWFKVLYMGLERYVAQVAGLRFEAPVVTPATVTYTWAEHTALVAALNATELEAKAVLTEIAGIRKLLKGQVTPPSVPTFP